MARKRSRSENGKTVYIDFTPEEEAARDVEEAAWEAGRAARDRDTLIAAEIERLRSDEDAQLKQKAEDTLRQRGEII